MICGHKYNKQAPQLIVGSLWSVDTSTTNRHHSWLPDDQHVLRHLRNHFMTATTTNNECWISAQIICQPLTSKNSANMWNPFWYNFFDVNTNYGHDSTCDGLGGNGIKTCLAMNQYSRCDVLMAGRGFGDVVVNVMLSVVSVSWQIRWRKCNGLGCVLWKSLFSTSCHPCNLNPAAYCPGTCSLHGSSRSRPDFSARQRQYVILTNLRNAGINVME